VPQDSPFLQSLLCRSNSYPNRQEATDRSFLSDHMSFELEKLHRFKEKNEKDAQRLLEREEKYEKLKE
jgi:hypothetical protein